VPDGFERTGHEFIVVRTGYNSDHEWVHHVHCACGEYDDEAYCYEDARELVAYHRKTAKPVKAGKVVKKVAKKKRPVVY
jgi:hypothetical protein